ncbi:hypothetical protein VT84_14000 [Gemmata sp. SH-PL17]|uniref:hypothetical protein n=1 Tax=Gemmata sp. SH-PL17 TaxID=1630693 RepID=UPI00078E8D67|nr:hypothetical protein [Gemmata sp. SH-PL17]AMV24604.1 hypothetical protein VT84_09425 [Gemmata sp. SH-PL17]AMV25507.1 hypothetical protein VT84_14000 [Gemmata sp. SH-PL17]
MIVRYMRPDESPSAVTYAIELDRPTRIDPDGSRWCEIDPEPHPGSGKPAVMGAPVDDYCPRLDGPLPG